MNDQGKSNLDLDCSSYSNGDNQQISSEGFDFRKVSDVFCELIGLFLEQTKYHPVRCLEKQIFVTPRERSIILTQALRRANALFKFNHEYLHLAVNVMDRFLMRHQLTSCQDLQLLVAVCLNIALKKELGTDILTVSEWLEYIDPSNIFTYSCHDFMKLELKVLNTIEFRLNVVSALSLLRCLMKLYMEMTNAASRLDELTMKALYETTEMILNESLIDYQCMQFIPAVRAYACMEVTFVYYLNIDPDLLTLWTYKMTGLPLDLLADASVAIICMTAIRFPKQSTYLLQPYFRQLKQSQ